ncbi:MAG: hypothetical protein L0Z62_34175 [Gemmataceae bacterium]|nr:hypothetical protein [Gemmataceae bacterium]
MFSAEDLYWKFAKKPFEPVRVYLKDGRTYDIHKRCFVVVGTTYLDIGHQLYGYAEGISGPIVTVPLEEISRVEPVAVAQF